MTSPARPASSQQAPAGSLVRRRRLARTAVAGLVIAVCATACGLSNTARSTISQGASTTGGTGTGTSSSGGVRTAAQGGGVTTAQQQAAAGGGGTDTSGSGSTDTSGSGSADTSGSGSTDTSGGSGTTSTDPGTAAAGGNISTAGGGTGATVGGGSVGAPASTAPVGGAGQSAGATTPTSAGKSGAPTSAGKSTAPTASKTTAPGKSKATPKPGTPTAGGGGGGAGGSTGGQAPGTTPTGGAAANSASCSIAGGDATGITDTDINIGLHAPLTGTGTPFPNNSFNEGSKIFWKQKDAAGKPLHQVCGRNVDVDFEDDTYTPTGATKVCSAFATTKFLVLGGAGTDQIQACATDTEMDRGNVPYLSAGVTENGLTSLSNYFAISLTYRQQGAIVAQAAKANGFLAPAASADGKQWAIITGDSGNFDDATKGITDALSAAGISFAVFRQNQSGNYQASATQLGTTLALKNYKTIYTLTAPGYWLYVTDGYYKQAPTGNGVTWTGPGVSFSDFLVAQLVCSGSANAINGAAYYLAPNTGLDRASADFQAAAKQDGQPGDDIQWGLYGLDQGVYDLMSTAAQTGLTRQNFISSVQNQMVNVNGSYAPLAFASSHFGGTGAFLQKINCGKTEPGQNQAGSWDTVGNNYLTP